ncbi:hypothetical protein [Aureimonas sp. ME7]|uniref:hypothetical protein n=1 Tax=Aureimonas sp. ME7 TaxID=2744252 RepID=UPI0015F56BA5|nr:hypothetical protein [Aureimonas sp. ME7]
MRFRLAAPLLSALILGASPGWSQTAEPPPLSGNEDAPGQAIPPSTDPCSALPQTGEAQTLSGQLQDCGGVLTPPDEGGSAIEAPVPAPDPGTTPVIPPSAVPDQPHPT